MNLRKENFRRAATLIAWALGCIFMVSACQNEPLTPTLTPIVISKYIATAYISPTPNAEQIAATRAASSPTPVPASPSPFPSITPYIGSFIGQAPRDTALQPITAPLFGSQSSGAAPTADATLCRLPIQPEFVIAWQTDKTINQRLGCPIQEGFGFFGEFQSFETGIMYGRAETREVWAINSGQPGRYWYVAAPERVPTNDILAPVGRFTPEGDFGSVWAGITELREAFGFAQTDEQRVGINLQRFDGGTFFLDASAGQIFVLLVDGTLYGPYEVTVPTPTPTALSPDFVLTEAATLLATPGQ
jgi:hypothetical protein